MTAGNGRAPVSITKLVLLPALITLGITILRLVGELEHWSTTLFNPQPGGFLGIVGIVWLVPIFGIYFALKLTSAGEGPPSMLHSIFWAIVGFVIFAAGFYLYNWVMKSIYGVLLMWALAAAAAALQFPWWRALWKTLIVYGLAARVPVAIVMALATRYEWQSHYSTFVPKNPKIITYFLFGFIPQLVWWVSFTIVIGSLFGIAAIALVRRESSSEAAQPTA
jgi:hypothetical protein